jgi:hypothetical protein
MLLPVNVVHARRTRRVASTKPRIAPLRRTQVILPRLPPPVCTHKLQDTVVLCLCPAQGTGPERPRSLSCHRHREGTHRQGAHRLEVPMLPRTLPRTSHSPWRFTSHDGRTLSHYGMNRCPTLTFTLLPRPLKRHDADSTVTWFRPPRMGSLCRKLCGIAQQEWMKWTRQYVLRMRLSGRMPHCGLCGLTVHDLVLGSASATGTIRSPEGSECRAR